MKLPKSYIKKYGISKKAWKEYKASLSKKRKTNKARTPIKKVVKVKRMTTRRRKKRRKRTRTVPIAPLIGLAGSTLFLPRRGGTATPLSMLQAGEYETAGKIVMQNFTGYSAFENKWDFMNLLHGIAPLLGGVIAHKIASMLGANRYFQNLPSPLNKLRI